MRKGAARTFGVRHAFSKDTKKEQRQLTMGEPGEQHEPPVLPSRAEVEPFVRAERRAPPTEVAAAQSPPPEGSGWTWFCVCLLVRAQTALVRAVAWLAHRAYRGVADRRLDPPPAAPAVERAPRPVEAAPAVASAATEAAPAPAGSAAPEPAAISDPPVEEPLTRAEPDALDDDGDDLAGVPDDIRDAVVELREILAEDVKAYGEAAMSEPLMLARFVLARPTVKKAADMWRVTHAWRALHVPRALEEMRGPPRIRRPPRPRRRAPFAGARSWTRTTGRWTERRREASGPGGATRFRRRSPRRARRTSWGLWRTATASRAS